MPSYGGTYVGIIPMGLIWSMEPYQEDKTGRNGFQMRVPLPKFSINFAIYESHLNKAEIDTSKGYSITQLSIERFSISPNTEHIEVDERKLKGTLLSPRGQGQFIGVLEMYGITYGVHCNLRTSLLAARG